MPVSERLLEILACPVCKVKVELTPDGSGLKCGECRRVYPIRDDIPVMLVDEAESVDDAEHDRLLAKAQAEGITPTSEA